MLQVKIPDRGCFFVCFYS